MIHRRVVTISVCLPVSVQCEVETDDENDPDLDDWQVVRVRRVDAEASARSVNENMDDDTVAEMVKLARKAKDV